MLLKEVNETKAMQGRECAQCMMAACVFMRQPASPVQWLWTKK